MSNLPPNTPLLAGRPEDPIIPDFALPDFGPIDDTGEWQKRLIEWMRKECRENLYFFCKSVLGYDKLVPHIHGPLCHLLEDGKKNRKKIVLPRGWYKTTVVSIGYPMWRAIRDANVRILLVQNTFENAVAKLSVIDSHFKNNQRFRELFPELLPTPQSIWRSNSMCVPRTKSFAEGTFECGGIGTEFTSRHYDVIIQDDTVSPKKDEKGEENIAPSQDQIGQAIGFHRLCIPLLNDVTDEIIVVGTRWFEKDLLSWIDEHEGSVYFRYERAVRETDGRPDPKGVLAWPERFPDHILAELEAGMGPYMFSCLYLNLPLQSRDMMFRAEWFKYYAVNTIPKGLYIYTTIDVAGDEKTNKTKKADYNCVCTCGKDMKTGFIYVLQVDRGKWNPGELIDKLFEHWLRWHPLVTGSEAVAYQGSVRYWIDERMRKANVYYRVEGISTGGRSKRSRIMGLQPVISSGTLLFLHEQQWLVSELIAFPYGAYDDGADALAMQITFWQTTPGAPSEDEEGRDDPNTLGGYLAAMDEEYQKGEGTVYDVLSEATRTVGRS